MPNKVPPVYFGSGNAHCFVGDISIRGYHRELVKEFSSEKQAKLSPKPVDKKQFDEFCQLASVETNHPCQRWFYSHSRDTNKMSSDREKCPSDGHALRKFISAEATLKRTLVPERGYVKTVVIEHTDAVTCPKTSETTDFIARQW